VAAPVGVGRLAFDQVVASGEVQTVATDAPAAVNWVPAISHFPPAPGATTLDRVEVSPPPSPRAAPVSLCQLYSADDEAFVVRGAVERAARVERVDFDAPAG